MNGWKDLKNIASSHFWVQALVFRRGEENGREEKGFTMETIYYACFN